MTELRIGYHTVPFPTDGADPEVFVQQFEAMLTAVEPAFDSVWFDDHLLPAFTFVEPDTALLECMTTIGFYAGRHPGLQFGALVLCQAFRNAALVAKMAANLQLLTAGRFVLGLGAGWLESEHLAYGYDFPAASTRIAQLAEAVQVVRATWADAPSSFTGALHSVTEVVCRPVPEPPPPILIGGAGERRTLRVVAEHADWWNTVGSPEHYGHKLAVLRRHCDAVGRDYEEIVKTWSAEVVAVAATEEEARRIAAASPFADDYALVGSPEQVAAKLRPIVALGVKHMMLRFVDFPSPAGALMFADEVVPRLR